MEKRKKLGLALGSGGARGFCHIGVLQALYENNIVPEYLTGCSMGSIVGGCFALGVTVEDMIKISETINQLVVMDLTPSIKKMGFMKGQRIINVIKKLVGDQTFADCKIPFKATASDLVMGTSRVLDEGKVIDAMRASMSIPIAFHAVPTEENTWLVDGGVIERIPIPLTKSMGADVVIAVDALGPLRPNYKPKNVLSLIERTYLMVDWQSTVLKLKEADLVISPDLGDRAIYDFTKSNIDLIEQGKLATLAVMNEIKELLEID